MDKLLRAKVKVLIKSYLLQYPNGLSASQMASMINQHRWGFSKDIDSKIIHYVIRTSGRGDDFLNCLQHKLVAGRKVYFIEYDNSVRRQPFRPDIFDDYGGRNFILEKIQEGYTQNRLAIEVGCTPAMIHYYCKKNGINWGETKKELKNEKIKNNN